MKKSVLLMSCLILSACAAPSQEDCNRPECGCETDCDCSELCACKCNAPAEPKN